MKRIVVIALFVSVAASALAKPLEVKVDPRVELLSIVFRLAGHPEYNMPVARSNYSQQVDQYFATYRDHEAVHKARRLRQTRGISYDAVMSLAVHLADDVANPAPRTPFDPRPELLEQRWKTDEARQFIESLAKFSRDSNFIQFIDEHRDYYKDVSRSLAARINEQEYVSWFDAFFGGRQQATFTVIAGLLNGGGNYGVSMRHHDGREEITPIIGIWKWSPEGMPAMGEELVPLVVHEFCHAYTNAIVDAHYQALKPAGDRLFNARLKLMQRQAYGNGRTVLYESFVRASVVHFMKSRHGPAAGQKQAEHEASKGFTWTADFAALLGSYDADRATYPDFNALMPRVIEFLDKTSQKVAAESLSGPAVVSMTPANGATDVSAAEVRQLVIPFDRPMRDKSWSIVGGDDVPPMGTPKYDPTCTVLTIPVTLAPNRTYRFSLNGPSHKAFASRKGEVLEPVEVSFSTRPG